MYGTTTHAGSAADTRSNRRGIHNVQPTVLVKTFRQDLDGYTGAKDTQLWQAAPTTNNAATADLTADYDTDSVTSGNQVGQVLVRFDNLFGAATTQVPADAVIHSAKLILNTPVNTTGTAYDSNDTFRAHRMILDWTDTATWNSLTAGVSADNIEAASNASFSIVPDVDGGPAIIDVTSDVVLFKAGAATNRGWVVRPSRYWHG